jgi:hypothetical protein
MSSMARRRAAWMYSGDYDSARPTQSFPATQAQPSLTPEQINPGLAPGMNASPQSD